MTKFPKMRHRGAFVAVSESFERVVERLLSSEKAHLIHYCRKWLETFMDQITEAGASITRRSAGLPMGILAIVGKTEYGRKVFLGEVMRELFRISKLPVIQSRDKDTIDMPQVHAMNVIKAVVHDSSVADEVPKYFADAFEICIESFSSPYFPIRNCSMMLFAALINKMFGAKKLSPDSISSAKVGGRAFFTKYPTLYNLSLTTMTAATDKLLKVRKLDAAWLLSN